MARVRKRVVAEADPTPLPVAEAVLGPVRAGDCRF